MWLLLMPCPSHDRNAAGQPNRIWTVFWIDRQAYSFLSTISIKMTHFKLAALALSVAALTACGNMPSAQKKDCADMSDPACVQTDAAQKGSAQDEASKAQAEADSIARFRALQQQMTDEVTDAENSLEAAVSATKGLPKSQRARNTSVQTATVAVTDSQSPRVEDITALDTASIELPIAGKKKAAYTNAMNAVKSLATRVADSRGGATILVEQNPLDVRARRVNASEGETQTKEGNTVTVEKSADKQIPRGIERYTIKAGELTQRP